jgi:hypothetical protein
MMNFHQRSPTSVCVFRAAPVTSSEEAEWSFFSSFFVAFWKDLVLDSSSQTESYQAKSLKVSTTTDEKAASFSSDWTTLSQTALAQRLIKTRTYPAFANLRLSAPPSRGDPDVSEPAATAAAVPTIAGSTRSMAADVLGALHSVFEDLLLNQLMWRHVPQLTALMALLSALIGASNWRVRFGTPCFGTLLRQGLVR